MVITEHDRRWPERELEELRAESGDLVVLAGVEVSTRQGDFLAYGLDPEYETTPGMELRELLQTASEHRAAIVAAHPFRWRARFDVLIEEHGPVFDALELASNNITPAERSLTESLLKRYPMGATASSDAHDEDAVGCYYTEFSCPIRTIEEFARAIKDRLGAPRHNPRSRRLVSGTLST